VAAREVAGLVLRSMYDNGTELVRVRASRAGELVGPAAAYSAPFFAPFDRARCGRT